MLEQQKAESGDAVLSAVLFSSSVRVLYDRVDLNDVPPLTEKDYRVGGGTALLDAIGGAVHHIARVHRHMPEESRPGKTVFVIITDGMENASRHYDSDTVRQMIQRQKELYGWEFIFLGANIDAVTTARRFGIDHRRAVNYRCDGKGTREVYEAMNRAVGNVRAARPLGDSWRQDVDKDFKQRK